MFAEGDIKGYADENEVLLDMTMFVAAFSRPAEMVIIQEQSYMVNLISTNAE